MKGFPNQIVTVDKLVKALQAIEKLLAAGANPINDGVFGEQLVLDQVIGTGHKKGPTALTPQQYLEKQKAKKKDSQSHRTAARGIREYFRLLGLIDDSSRPLKIKIDGQEILNANRNGNTQLLNNKIRESHFNIYLPLADPTRGSHPYRIMLKLIEEIPGIKRQMCSLAFAPMDDSLIEYNKIKRYATSNESELWKKIHTTEKNWINNQKVLPSIAIAVGDVIEVDGGLHLNEQKNGLAKIASDEKASAEPSGLTASAHPPEVAAENVAQGAIGERRTLSNEEQEAAARLLNDRTNAHQEIVRALAKLKIHATLREKPEPYDLLSVPNDEALPMILWEVKSIDSDFQIQVRAAVGQLLSYDYFRVKPCWPERKVYRVVVVNQPGNKEWSDFLDQLNIGICLFQPDCNLHPMNELGKLVINLIQSITIVPSDQG